MPPVHRARSLRHAWRAGVAAIAGARVRSFLRPSVAFCASGLGGDAGPLRPGVLAVLGGRRRAPVDNQVELAGEAVESRRVQLAAEVARCAGVGPGDDAGALQADEAGPEP